MHQLWIIAGPNGSGKTTLTNRHLVGKLPIINPDEIARQINPDQPEKAAVQAGRSALQAQAQLISKKESFALETTFSGNREIALMKEAKAAGYKVNLVFVCTKTPAASISRVWSRVQEGGHSVPVDDVERRYRRSLKNLPEGIKIADRAWLIDNTGKRPRLVATLEHGREKSSSMNLPKWIRSINIPALDQGMGMGF